jgi:hypothetical protein
MLTAPAHAQLREGSWRLGIDVDVFSGGVVHEDPRGPVKDQKTGVIGVGPNQLGSSRAVIDTPPLGVSFAYALKHKWMLGLRSGIGYDRLSSDQPTPDRKVLGLSFMPEVTFVPLSLSESSKLFARFSPILQYDRLKVGSATEHIFMGCFSVGVGTFLFLTPSSSIDIGAYFEGRFGKLKPSPLGGSYVDVDDLRGLIRVGLSLWK